MREVKTFTVQDAVPAVNRLRETRVHDDDPRNSPLGDRCGECVLPGHTPGRVPASAASRSHTSLRPYLVRNAANVSHPMTAPEEGGRLSFCEKAASMFSRHLAVLSRVRRWWLSRAIGDTAVRAADARGKGRLHRHSVKMCSACRVRRHLRDTCVGRAVDVRRQKDHPRRALAGPTSATVLRRGFGGRPSSPSITLGSVTDRPFIGPIVSSVHPSMTRVSPARASAGDRPPAGDIRGRQAVRT